MGVFTGIDYSATDRRIVVQRSQDVEPIIEHLAALRQEGDGKSKSGELYHVGDIPMAVVEGYLAEAGVTFHDFIKDDTHVKRILTNPDFAKFRVWQGRW
jgi:hypothetical protein